MKHTPARKQCEDYQPKRVLITGGAGFIGCNLIRFILEHYPDIYVVNFDLLTYAGHLDNLEDLPNQDHYSFIRGDITDHEAVDSAMTGCDSVINLAAETHVDSSIIDSTPFVRTNVLGTQVLLDTALHHHVQRFIQIGTDEVYGSLGLDDRARFTEESPLHPNSPYAASKAAADHLALSYHRTYRLPTIVTRCSNNFGPYQYPEKVIPLFVSNLLNDKKVPLYGDGLNVRDWIHVDDHAEAIIRVLISGRVGEIYNIGAENESSNLELTRQLLALCNCDDSRIEFVEDRPGHDRRYAVDPSKICRELNWRASRSDWPDALTDTVNWYRDHQPWCETIRQEYKLR